VGVTKSKSKINQTLFALTTAALSLPGLDAEAAIPVSEAKANFQYGHYQESDDRMKVQIYHADMILPLADRFELTFSIDQDTYSGATPIYSLPEVMKNEPKRKKGTNIFIPTDIVVSASPVAGTFEVTSAMQAYKSFEDAQQKYKDDYIANPPTPRLSRDDRSSAARIAGYTALITKIAPSAGKVFQTMEIHPQETRNMPILGVNYYFDDVTLSMSSGISDEPDFKSTFGNWNVSWELPNKLTTLNIGGNVTGNNISRAVIHSDAEHVHNGDEDYPELDEQSLFYGFNWGISQVLGKNTLLQVSSGYTRQAGYLTNPYKLVYVRGEITAEEYEQLNMEEKIFQDVTDLEVMGVELFREVRPEERNQWTVSSQLRQYIPGADASVHLDYRYYNDDWGIDSHTFEATWYQSLPHGITIAPNIRYYTQSQADFYAPYFLAPRADGNYSSDYRLSGYGALSGGVTFTKEFTKGFSLEAGFEYYTHQGELKLGSGGEGDFADYSSYLAHGALKIDLSNPGRFLGAHNGHHGHHAGPLPAGVMFGHMMENAGDMMIGYNYMYSDRDGDMRYGMDRVGDQAIIDNACDLKKCTFKPDAMVMHMHMFNFMYAPTDWLNLMLMPQIINMEMVMEPLKGAAEDDSHVGGHVSDGLGDTLMVALFKVFKHPNHNLHVGIGFSAPTANINATLDGTGLADSERQSYAMQLGSGTWDFKPSLTYTGNVNNWMWGAQISGTKRMQHRNKEGYVLGDEFQGTAWGGYKFLPWLSGVFRGIYSVQGKVRGETVTPNSQSAPNEFPENYGGQFFDLGTGVSVSSPGGEFVGHSLSVEWVQPILHDYNGYQFEREGSLSVNWGYAF